MQEKERNPHLSTIDFKRIFQNLVISPEQKNEIRYEFEGYFRLENRKDKLV